MTGPEDSPSWHPGRAPWFVWVLTAAFMLVVTLWASLTLSLRAPDEMAHLSTVYRLSVTPSWPDPGSAVMPGAVVAAGDETSLPQSERSSFNELAASHPEDSERGDQMTQHPPLYYAIMAAALNIPGVKDLPWGQALFLLRALGAVFAAPLIWLSWNSAALLTRSRRVAAVAVAVPFAVPQVAQNFGTLTNDSAAILASWIVTWLSIRVWTGDRRPRVLLGLGVAFGLSALTKGTALPLGLLVALVLLLGPGTATWRRRIVDLAWPMAVAFLVGGWWWLRNLVLYGTLQPDGMGSFTNFPEWEAGESPSVTYYISEVWRVTVTSFWGWFGRVNAPLPEPLVELLTILCATVLVVGGLRFRRNIPTFLVLISPVVATAIIFIRSSWAAYLERTEPGGLHGRYFFTMLLILIVISALAAAALVREPGPRKALAVTVVAGTAMMIPTSFVVAIVGLWGDFSLTSFDEAARTWVLASPLPSEVDAGQLIAIALTTAAGLVGALRFALSSAPAHSSAAAIASAR